MRIAAKPVRSRHFACVAQYPDAMVTRWKVNTDIGEIEIERDENPFLCLRCVKHL